MRSGWSKLIKITFGIVHNMKPRTAQPVGSGMRIGSVEKVRSKKYRCKGSIETLRF